MRKLVSRSRLEVFFDLGIGARLALGFGVVCGLLALAVSAAGVFISQTEDRVRAITTKRLPASQQSSMMAAHFTASTTAVYRYVMIHNPHDRAILDGEWSSIVEAGDKVDAVSDGFEPTMRTAWKELMTEFDAIYQVEYAIVAEADARDTTGGQSPKLLERMADLERRIEHILTVLSGVEDEHGERRGGISGESANLLAEDAAQVERALFWLERGLWTLLAGSLGLSALIATTTSHSIVAPIGALTRAMVRLAGGDTELSVPSLKRHDEVGAMAKAVEVFRENGIRLREREVELRAARDEAISASRAKSEFLSSISHELRTPLNAIIGFAKLIADAAYGPAADPKYHEYARDIEGSGIQLLTIINDIIDLAKFEAGRIKLQADHVELAPLFAAVRATLEPKAAAAGVALTTMTVLDGVTIWGDERLLRRALGNLLSNAIKFSRSSGWARLEYRSISGKNELVVIDNGIGMREVEVARVLQPFSQRDGSLERRYSGAGLGLPLAKAIAELHSGVLIVESEPEVGTTVIIRLAIA